jgi:HPt (histidine-containing phosphotransfer) domain-containing protein
LGDLRQALKAGDLERARRLVHTVKGVAGNLGATELSRAARALEPGLQQQGDEPFERLWEAFAGRLDEVLGSVLLLEQVPEEAHEAPAASPGVPREPLERSRIERLFRKLGALLEADNLNALGVWEELKPLLPGEAAGRLDLALQGLDFPEATRMLNDLALALEITL